MSALVCMRKDVAYWTNLQSVSFILVNEFNARMMLSVDSRILVLASTSVLLLSLLGIIQQVVCNLVDFEQANSEE